MSDQGFFVLFHCPGCNVRTKVPRPERAIAVDIVFWLDSVVAPRVSRVHSALSPTCHEPNFDLALPIDNEKDDPNRVVGQLHDKTRHKGNELGIFDRGVFADDELPREPLSDAWDIAEVIETVPTDTDPDDQGK